MKYKFIFPLLVLACFTGIQLSLCCQAEPLHVAIDRLIEQATDQPFASEASDSEILRRLYLDLAGQIPSANETRSFLQNQDPDKRTALIDHLLQDPRYVRRMTELFNVMLMERRGEHATWTQFLAASFQENLPWTQMVQTMIEPDLTNPDQQGAGFFLTKRLEKYGQNPTDHPGLATDIGRIFMGVDLACSQCHDHLFVDDYKQADFQGLFAFVNNTFIRSDTEFPAIGQRVMKSALQFQSVFEEQGFMTGPRIPGQAELPVPEYVPAEAFAVAPNKETKAPGVPAFNPLQYLAQNLPTRSNDAFNRNIANRLWFVMMGKGLVQPLDLHHSSNPPTHPRLMELLTTEFVEHDYDIKWFLRELSLTKVYQRSGILNTNGVNPERAIAEYRVFPEKPISAEQLMWSLLRATRMEEIYPRIQNETEQDDASPSTLEEVRVQFLDAFANPPREPEVEFAPSVRGALFLLNSELILNWIGVQEDNLTSDLSALDSPAAIAEELYITVLSRAPSVLETRRIVDHLNRQPDKQRAIGQAVWALLASNEFIINH